jgi:[ribosomal protein S5]-alanine N-acetyltransferase
MSTLVTARLVLSPFGDNDCNELFLARRDPEVMRYWDWPPDASVDETRHAAKSMLEDAAAGRGRYWTIRDRNESAFVGIIDLSESDGVSADLGFMLVRARWGLGLASEAAERVIDVAWELGLRRLRARVHADNVRSSRFLERLGFGLQVACETEIRPGVTKLCCFFALERPPSVL